MSYFCKTSLNLSLKNHLDTFLERPEIILHVDFNVLSKLLKRTTLNANIKQITCFFCFIVQ